MNLSVSDIAKVVSAVSRYSVADLRGPSKSPDLAHWRHIIAYLARKHTKRSYPQIAAYLGDRNHTSCLYAFRKIDQLVRAGETEDVAAVQALLFKEK